MSTKTKLVNGRILPNTPCPYKEECEIAKNDQCSHKGEQHPVAFSCGLARAFAILDRDL